MAKVTYAPSKEQIEDDALPEATTVLGYDFASGKSVEVTNPSHLRKFDGHPFFKVSGDIPADTAVRTSAERDSALLGQGSKDVVTGQPTVGPAIAPVPDQPQRGPDKVTPGQADAPNGDSDLRAVHRGRGVYAVMRGDKDEEVIEGLSKEDAEAFNNLSAEDKLAYVAAPPAA